MDEALAGALEVAKLGARVFPVWSPRDGACSCKAGGACESPGKHPIEAGWQKTATTSPARIKRWYETTFPGCNFGYRTDDVVIVDVDPRNGGELGDLIQVLPGTQWLVSTGGGGWHLGFAPNGHQPNAKIGPGVDLKGEGGFVVAPGSRHASGMSYAWDPEAPEGALPMWPGIDTARGAVVVPGVTGGPGEAQDGAPRTGWIGTVWGGVGEGQRNDTCARLAGYLISHGLSTDIVLTMMLDWGERCDPPMAEYEIRRTVQSVDKKERSKALEPQTAADPDAEREAKIAARMISIEVDTEARRRIKAGTFEEPPPGFLVGDFIAQPDDPEPWAVKGLLQAGGNALFAAQYKAGKTTTMLNLMKSLADGTPFLGQIEATLSPGRRVAFFNYEMTADQFRAWVRAIGILNVGACAVLNLRGASLHLEEPMARAWITEWLREWKIEHWIIDPFARAYAGDENSNTEASYFTGVLDDIKADAGVETAYLAAHFGRQSFEEGTEHVRGATRLDDWADSRWMLVRGRDSDDRYFSAQGRDVDFEESRLQFHYETRTLSVVGGSRRTANHERTMTVVENHLASLTSRFSGNELRSHLTGKALRAEIDGRDAEIDASLRQLVAAGHLKVVTGPHGERWHYPSDHPETAQESMI